jgi:NitT/TauT family transport system permease protein
MKRVSRSEALDRASSSGKSTLLKLMANLIALSDGRVLWWQGRLRSAGGRRFPALFLITLAGVALFVFMIALSKLALGQWHESEIGADS